MSLTQIYRGDDFCPYCGEYVEWIRLMSGMWIAINPVPVLFIPGQGKRWLIEYKKWDAEFIKDCLIYEAGREMDRDKVIKGYMPHAWECSGQRMKKNQQGG